MKEYLITDKSYSGDNSIMKISRSKLCFRLWPRCRIIIS